ncbi:XVIPCD domain-containing protein [Solilutibacter silvestris]|uniref:Chitinase class I n=1 Tax=Solilutibacter silvestris TaxID=1645665 RepID=A0A2K1PYR9_9GAMM|nr:XVIPCD domain-containing protein [Lysobacter silvestris]PNS07933.1 Chitinase class I [Lysobacter silvestris]
MSQDREQEVLKAAVAHGITNPRELANFMAQTTHESMGLSRLEEGFRYTKGIGQIPVAQAHRHGDKVLEAARVEALHGRPDALAELMYGMRKDLGNDLPGDGFKYHGRGYIQLTGKANYTAAGKDLGLDLVNHPELASRPENATKIALWYWDTRVSEKHHGNVKLATHDINGKENGLPDRLKRFEHWQKVLTPETIQNIKEGKLGQPTHADPPHGHMVPRHHTAAGYHSFSTTGHGAHVATQAHAARHPLINEAGHPSHAMYEQIKAQTDKLGGAKVLGFHSDKEYTQALANMTWQARASGLTQVDHVMETTNKQNLVMIQGDLRDPAQQRELSNKAQASQVPVAQSTQQLQQDVQQLQQTQQNALHLQQQKSMSQGH